MYRHISSVFIIFRVYSILLSQNWSPYVMLTTCTLEVHLRNNIVKLDGAYVKATTRRR
jgi:hypothetical protein